MEYVKVENACVIILILDMIALRDNVLIYAVTMVYVMPVTSVDAWKDLKE